MDIWTDITWANFMKSQGVPEMTYCLMECKWNQQSQHHVPIKVVEIAKGRNSDALNVPKDGKAYVIGGYYPFSSGNGYVIMGCGRPENRNI